MFRLTGSTDDIWRHVPGDVQNFLLPTAKSNVLPTCQEIWSHELVLFALTRCTSPSVSLSNTLSLPVLFAGPLTIKLLQQSGNFKQFSARGRKIVINHSINYRWFKFCTKTMDVSVKTVLSVRARNLCQYRVRFNSPKRFRTNNTLINTKSFK